MTHEYVIDRDGIESILEGRPGNHSSYMLRAMRVGDALSNPYMSPSVTIAMHQDAIPPTHPRRDRLNKLNSVIMTQQPFFMVQGFVPWFMLDQHALPDTMLISTYDVMYAIGYATATGATVLTGDRNRDIYAANSIKHIAK